MKIGLIIKNEEYWSLKKINNDILNALGWNFDLMIIRLENNKIGNQNDLDEMYKQCDLVIYLASKLTNFRRKYDKPTVFYMHAWMDHGAGINIYINRSVFKYNDILLFTSSSARNKFNEVYDTSLKTIVLPYFTKSRIILDKKEEKCLRSRYGISEKMRILIYFGRFSPEKNIELFFEIANKLKDPNFVILAVGDFVGGLTFGFGDSKEEKYKEKIEKRIFSDASKKIIFLKDVNDEDLCGLMRISYLNVNLTTCFEEDFSLSTIESISAGLPVVASNWGGIKDIIRNDKEGFLIKTYLTEDNKVCLDIDEAIDFLNKMLFNIDIRKNLSENSLLRHKELYSKEAFLKNVNLLLISINNNKREVEDFFIEAKRNYESVYVSALEKNSVGRIYLDNPWLFRSLYKNYLGNIYEN